MCHCITNCVSSYYLYTPTQNYPHPLQEKKEPCNNVPSTNNCDNPYCVCKDTKKPSLFDVECYMFLFCWSSLFTCVHVFSSLSLSTTCTNLTINPLLHCNKYHTTNTNNPPRHEGSVAGLAPVFIQFSAVRASPQPARLTSHYTLHLCQACRDVLWPRS